MKKWSIYSIAATLIALMLNKAEAQSLKLLKTTHLENYPSASGIEFYNGKLYIMGDDATHLLALNPDHQPIDSVSIFQYNGKRIHYTIKPDLESLTIGTYKRDKYLIAMPSFSAENRNTIYAFPLENIRQYKTFVTTLPISHLKSIGIQEPNLEGAAIVDKRIIVSNRANFAQPVNYLVQIPVKKRSLKKCNRWKKAAIGLPATDSTIGISGLEYWPEDDLLLFTASTEATSSATADGAIGQSYLGLFSNFSKKKRKASVTPDKLLNLSQELNIGNQKVEGICVESLSGNVMILHLVTDNDDGQSILYKAQLTF
jgi:hypothetical protein